MSANLSLPYLAPSQAQKHVTLNESLARLDAIVQLSVVSATTAAEPGSPDDGAVWIMPAGKSGAHWASFADGSLAYYRDGAWEQITPRDGWLASNSSPSPWSSPTTRRGGSTARAASSPTASTSVD